MEIKKFDVFNEDAATISPIDKVNMRKAEERYKKEKAREAGIQRFEAYEVDDDRYEDFAEEHAKVVISNYIDDELDGVSLQDAFDAMSDDYDLLGAADGTELEQNVKTALVNYLERMLDDAMEIEVGNNMKEDKPKKSIPKPGEEDRTTKW